MRNYVEVGAADGAPGPLAIDIPASHQGSVRGLLSSLVPPGLPADISLTDLADMLSVADFLGLDARHTARCETRYRDQAASASLPELVALLRVAPQGSYRATLDWVLHKVGNNIRGIVGLVAQLEGAELREIVSNAKLGEDQDAAWALVSAWWQHHQGSAWPTFAELDGKGLCTVVRWHELTDEQFGQCAQHGCFSWETYDAWERVRNLTSQVDVSYRACIEVTVGGHIFPACEFNYVWVPASLCKDPNTGKWGGTGAPTLRTGEDVAARKLSVNEQDDFVVAEYY